MIDQKDSLQELFNQAYSDAVSAGVPVPPKQAIQVLFNRNIGRAWGRASKDYLGKDTYKIELSKLLCSHTDSKSIKNTMIHELVHCAGAWGHRKLFKQYAKLINLKFPGYYSVSRCTSAQTKMGSEAMHENYKYLLKCPKCGHLWGYRKFTKLVRNPETGFCPFCWKSGERDSCKLVREK